MGDNRLKVLAEARRILEERNVSLAERNTLLKLLEILASSLEKQFPENVDSLQNISEQLINNQSLLALLKQQTDELDALKK